MAGSPSAPRRFPCVPAHPAPVLTHRNSRARGPALSSQPCSGSSICRCHPCAAAPERRGQGTHRETPSTGAALQHAKHKPKNQARPCNGRSSPWIFWKAESAAAPQLPKQCWQLEDLWLSITPIQHHSSGFFPQLMLLNTWLMKESQSLECCPSSCQFWHFSHHSTRNKSHLLPCWVTGITKPLSARGSQPCWHSQGTVKSSAGSKTAQSQEDREYQTLGSGSSCQHLLKQQPSSTSPTKPLVVVHPLTELVSSGLKPGNC